ncbi:MAG: TIGR04282 family arsenosugar biosynthesis glycosyltransferase [Acidimicrobiia bacterium]
MTTAPATAGSILVMAKSPRPGRSKTRLCPPCTPHQAAGLAEAALADTLAAVAAVPRVRRVVVLDGPAGRWLPPAFEVFPQRSGSLDERLAAAFADAHRGAGEPTLLIGMDTPQVTPGLLGRALEALDALGADAVLGAARDGGWWALGLRQADPDVFRGVPMSTGQTGSAQRRRLQALGLTVRDLSSLRDVDYFDDAVAVAAEIPGSSFARALAALDLTSPARAQP